MIHLAEVWQRCDKRSAKLVLRVPWAHDSSIQKLQGVTRASSGRAEIKRTPQPGLAVIVKVFFNEKACLAQGLYQVNGVLVGPGSAESFFACLFSMLFFYVKSGWETCCSSHATQSHEQNSAVVYEMLTASQKPLLFAQMFDSLK